MARIRGIIEGQADPCSKISHPFTRRNFTLGIESTGLSEGTVCTMLASNGGIK
jgi:hypothetical protein